MHPDPNVKVSGLNEDAPKDCQNESEGNLNADADEFTPRNQPDNDSENIVNEQQEGNSMEHDSVESEADGDVP